MVVYEEAKNIEIGRVIYHYDEGLAKVLEATYSLTHKRKDPEGLDYKARLESSQKHLWETKPPCVIIDKQVKSRDKIILTVLLIIEKSNPPPDAARYMVPFHREGDEFAPQYVELTDDSDPWPRQKAVNTFEAHEVAFGCSDKLNVSHNS